MTARPATLVAEGLTFPTGVVVAEDGTLFVAESGLPFGGAPPGGRVVEVGRDGRGRTLVEGLAPPVTGLCAAGDGFVVSEGGAGRLVHVASDGRTSPLVEGLPGPGNYHTNGPVLGPDGRLYFSQGAMTNTGVVGLDAYELGWLGRLPHAHDVPGYDIVLAGLEFETDDPFADDPGARARTGAFCAFGRTAPPGTRVAGQVRCTAAVLRCDLDGGGLELVAWGLRNAFGLAFLPDGRLLAVDQGADDRGSRPVGEVSDVLYDVRPGAWYGWPDFVGGVPLTSDAFRPSRGPAPQPVLLDHGALPPPEPALVRFPPHAAATRPAVAPPGAVLPAGHVAVALFGDERPMTAPEGPRVGRSVVSVDPDGWAVAPVAGPPFSRPIDVAFDSDGSLLVLDFGAFEMTGRGVAAAPGTGALWRVAP